MAHVALFHSALGLRPAVVRFADALRADGHVVVTPDLFDGETFDRLEDGVAKRDAVGIAELSRRAHEAVNEMPSDCVYAGFSMGAASAQMLAMTRPGARACVMMHALLPTHFFGADHWPSAVPVQVHVAEHDPWVDAAVVDAVAGGSADAVNVFRYRGGAHLFADDDSADFDADHAALMLQRVRAFVASVSSRVRSDTALVA